MIAVKIENVKKSYKDTKALKGVSAEIKSGELYGLLGLNGAGKTTLISVIAGLIKADEGDITVDGKSVKTDSDEVKRIIAVSPQETAVAPNLTVKENLEFFAELYGKPKDRAIIAMQEFGLTEVANKRAKTLSGGYARRLSIAAAVITEPKLLILDEPTLGLDVIARRELWKLINARKGKTTIILTTHYLEEVEALCDRICALKEGEKIFEGTVDEMKTLTGEENFEDAFVKISQGEICHE
ncbi:MAG: ABC transporter ATP-binding protein [Candidatus Borkfalkiaceae bacterium]|nr:ABC transporter ATP-binding protein [Eubacteriales bacterium]MDY5820787.1 ABC transporter ATP-binding protein [Christensenellaceae bacterium]